MELTTPVHGGRLAQAARDFGIPENDWLDLSTGINPWNWPVPNIPTSIWQRLPESTDALKAAAHQYYGGPVLAVPGSQWAIQVLPALFDSTRVWLPDRCYEEHPYWWQQHQHQLLRYSTLPDANQLQPQDIVIVVNPNNPNAEYTNRSDLLQLANILETKNGFLIVDEAFMDWQPQASLIQSQPRDNVIILRSLGKFFGLAGLRLGFVHCHGNLQQRLQNHLGPWGVSHPAVYLGEQALRDVGWQQHNRQRIQQTDLALNDMLTTFLPNMPKTSCGLFTYLSMPCEQAQALHQHCGKQGILLRHFEQQDGLRLGLVKTEQISRLADCLSGFHLDK